MLIITGATGKLGSQLLHDLLLRVPADQLVASVRAPQKTADLLAKRVRRVSPVTSPARWAGDRTYSAPAR